MLVAGSILGQDLSWQRAPGQVLAFYVLQAMEERFRDIIFGLGATPPAPPPTVCTMGGIALVPPPVIQRAAPVGRITGNDE